MSEDFYEVLGVSRDASADEIQQAYRKKAAEYHPDVSDDPDAEEKFKKVKKAKEVLTDEEKRQAYDQMGHDRFEQAEKRGGFDGGGMGGGAGAGQGNPFGGMGGGGGFEDLFNEFFSGQGGGPRGRDRPRKGSDLRTSLTIDLEDAYEGIRKQLSITRPEVCPDCDGAGHPPDADARTCPECNGRGQTTQVQQTPFGRVQQTQTCRRCGGEGEIYDDTCDTCGGDGRIRDEANLSVERFRRASATGRASGWTARAPPARTAGRKATSSSRSPSGSTTTSSARATTSTTSERSRSRRPSSGTPSR